MMDVSDSNKLDGLATMALVGDLDLRAAAPLAKDILGRRGAGLQIDASAVTGIGGQCLQVLLCALSTWAEEGFRLVIINPSQVMMDHLNLLGVGRAQLDTETA